MVRITYASVIRGTNRVDNALWAIDVLHHFAGDLEDILGWY